MQLHKGCRFQRKCTAHFLQSRHYRSSIALGIALRPRALPEDSVCRPMSQQTCMAILQFALETPFQSVMEGCHPRIPRWQSMLFLHPHRQYTVFDDRRPLDKVCFPQRSIADQRQKAYPDLPQRPRDTVSGFAPLPVMDPANLLHHSLMDTDQRSELGCPELP